MSTNLNEAVSAAQALPPRQKEVLACISAGLLAKETADRLKISESTVCNTRKVIYCKLRVTNAVEAARVAFSAGFF